jgi:tRNA pseudouridine38-40 synthase
MALLLRFCLLVNSNACLCVRMNRCYLSNYQPIYLCTSLCVPLSVYLPLCALFSPLASLRFYTSTSLYLPLPLYPLLSLSLFPSSTLPSPPLPPALSYTYKPIMLSRSAHNWSRHLAFRCTYRPVLTALTAHCSLTTAPGSGPVRPLTVSVVSRTESFVVSAGQHMPRTSATHYKNACTQSRMSHTDSTAPPERRWNSKRASVSETEKRRATVVDRQSKLQQYEDRIKYGDQWLIDHNQTDTDQHSHTQQPKPPRTKKRRYAIVFGFVGDNYRGMQQTLGQRPAQLPEVTVRGIPPAIMRKLVDTPDGDSSSELFETDVSSNTDAHVDVCAEMPPTPAPTPRVLKAAVEDVLEAALFQAGLITESNVGEIRKSGWSRSSRTDKGVHAAGVICSAKLQTLNADEIIPRTAPFLPDDMQLFAAYRTSRNFYVRRACGMRQYEYLLPESWLPEGPDALARWKHALSLFKGNHNFHNFSASGRPKLNSDESYIDPADHKSMYQRDMRLFAARRTDMQQLYRNVLAVTPERVEIGGVVYQRVTLLGISFVYHQIRRMIGGALACAHGVIDPEVLRIAIEAPFKVRIPLAPAQFLLLDMLEDPLRGSNPQFVISDDVLRRVALFKESHVYRRISQFSSSEECAATRSDFFDKELAICHIEDDAVDALAQQYQLFSKHRDEKLRRKQERMSYMEAQGIHQR